MSGMEPFAWSLPRCGRSRGAVAIEEDGHRRVKPKDGRLPLGMFASVTARRRTAQTIGRVSNPSRPTPHRTGWKPLPVHGSGCRSLRCGSLALMTEDDPIPQSAFHVKCHDDVLPCNCGCEDHRRIYNVNAPLTSKGRP